MRVRVRVRVGARVGVRVRVSGGGALEEAMWKRAEICEVKCDHGGLPARVRVRVKCEHGGLPATVRVRV